MRVSLIVVLIFTIACNQKSTETEQIVISTPEAISLLGDSLYASTPSDALLLKYEQSRKDHLEDIDNPDKLIWFGRFTAYTGRYNEAIEIFNNGNKKFPNDPRFLRHMGHRNISIRQFDKAIQNLSAAAAMIEGRPDQIEPDGMPNEQGVPVSSLNTNIWYHLGLAYYLKDDLESALLAYENGIKSCTNDDMLVAFIHWKYMALRQLGRNDEAKMALDKIKLEMNVIESFEYHKLGQFYKGLINLDDLSGPESNSLSGASEALQFGIANWYLYNGNSEMAEQLFRDLYSSGNWAGFGYIASEMNLKKLSRND